MGEEKQSNSRPSFGMTIDINKTRPADNPGYSHFSLLVDDIKEVHKRLILRAIGLMDQAIKRTQNGTSSLYVILMAF